MRGAFVLRLKAETETAKGNFAGWIEEVDTGKELCFRSTPELLNFLAQRFDAANSPAPAEAAHSRERDATTTTSKPRRDEPMNANVLAPEAQNVATAKAKIGRVFEAIVESWNRHDMATYAAQFTTNADFVNVIGMRWRGTQEIEARHVDLHRTIFRNSKLRGLDRSVRFLRPNLAVAHQRWEMTGHEGLPGWQLPEARQGIMTCVLVEEAGQWRIEALQNTDILPLQMPK